MYEELLKEGEKNGIEIIEIPLKGNLKGLYGDNIIAINSKMTTNNEKTCILAEELGHHYKNYGNILDQTDINNRKQEMLARRWAYEKLVSLNRLIDGYKYGCQNRYELAEYLNVTERFIEEVIKYYKSKYGLYCQVDNYIIYFEPLGIMEVWE